MVHALFHRLRDLSRQWQSESRKSGFFRRLHRRAYYFLLTWLERRIYADLRISLAAVSWRTATLFKGLFHREDVRVIPYGVNAIHFSFTNRLALRAQARSRYKFQEADFVLLLIGNDWRNKGLSTVLDAMAALGNVPLHLVVAGQDAAEPFFRQAGVTLRLKDRCRWETASVDAVYLYAAADIYVSPTREDAFALPTLESMACGLPIITSVNNGGSQIISEGVDGFVLADPGDAVMPAGHLKNLYEHPDLRRRIGENARRTAEEYTWDRHAAAAWEFLTEVASNEAGRSRPPVIPLFLGGYEPYNQRIYTVLIQARRFNQLSPNCNNSVTRRGQTAFRTQINVWRYA